MSAVLDKVHTMSGLAPLFAEHGASNVHVFDLPPIPEYAPEGGIGFLVELDGRASGFGVLELEELLERRLGQSVVVMTRSDESFHIPPDLLDNAEPL